MPTRIQIPNAIPCRQSSNAFGFRHAHAVNTLTVNRTVPKKHPLYRFSFICSANCFILSHLSLFPSQISDIFWKYTQSLLPKASPPSPRLHTAHNTLPFPDSRSRFWKSETLAGRAYFPVHTSSLV